MFGLFKTIGFLVRCTTILIFALSKPWGVGWPVQKPYDFGPVQKNIRFLTHWEPYVFRLVQTSYEFVPCQNHSMVYPFKNHNMCYPLTNHPIFGAFKTIRWWARWRAWRFVAFSKQYVLSLFKNHTICGPLKNHTIFVDRSKPWDF